MESIPLSLRALVKKIQLNKLLKTRQVKLRTYIDQKDQDILQIFMVKELILQIVSQASQELELRLEPLHTRDSWKVQ